MFSYSQWKFNSVVDPFDGERLTAVGSGYGGEFPYRTPVLIIRKQKNELDIYVSDAGYTGCDGLFLEFSFGDPNEVISFNALPSTDNDAAFISYSKGSKSVYKVIELIEKLKSNSIVYVKSSSDCGHNIFKIGLRGSSNAINKTVGSYLDKLKEDYNEFLKSEEIQKEIEAKELQEKKEAEERARVANEKNKLEELRKFYELGKLKEEKLKKITSMLPPVDIIPSVNIFDNIMKQQKKQHALYYSTIKPQRDITDIDSISLIPSTFKCFRKIVVYDFDLPKKRQGFVSNYDVKLKDDYCSEQVGLINSDLTREYQIIRIGATKLPNSSAINAKVFVGSNYIEIDFGSSSVGMDGGKEYFISREEKENEIIYIFPTSKEVEEKTIRIYKKGKRVYLEYNVKLDGDFSSGLPVNLNLELKKLSEYIK